MLGSATLTTNDGGLGVSEQLRRPVAVVGCSSSGTADSPVALSTPDDVTSTFGYGPLAEVLALVLALAGGPVVGVKAATATAGVVGGVAQSGAGSAGPGTLVAAGGNTSTAIPALTGTPDKPYAVKIVVTTAGSNLAASPVVKVSLDGGVTFLATGSIAASASAQAIGSTGLSLAWTDGTFVLNESWSAYGDDSPTTGATSGTSVLTVSGTPSDAFDVRVQVTRASSALTALTGAFKVSLDGGNSYSEEIALATTGAYVVPNTGLTLTFGSGTHVVGEVFRFQTSAPAWDTTGLGTALAALVASGRDFEFVHVAGAVDATSAATVKTWLDAREAAGQYTFAVCEARDQLFGESIATWQTVLTGSSPGFGTFTGDKQYVMASHGEIQSAVRAGVYWRRNLARLLSARLAKIPLRESPMRVKTGPVEGLKPDGSVSSVYHDGRTYTALDLARLGVVQTIAGRPQGEYYFTSRTMASSSSDFSEVQRIRVMNEAARVGLAAIAEYVGDDVELKTDGTGRIAEKEAKAVEAEVLAKVKAAVLNAPNVHVSSVGVLVNRTDNVASSRTLRVAISLVPRGSIIAVTATLTYRLS